MTRLALALALLLVACGKPPAPAAAPSAPMVAVPLAGDDAASPDAPAPSTPNGIESKGAAPTGDFTFPDAAGWQKLEFHRFERPELGVSHGYRFAARGGQATVFVYDDGIEHIPDDVEAEVVSAQFKRAQAEIDYAGQRGMYKEVALQGERRVQVGAQEMLHAHYRLVMPNGVALGSDIYLFTFGGRFLKVRVSYEESTTPITAKGIEVLLEALVEATARPPQA